jgi:hypothetical protein
MYRLIHVSRSVVIQFANCGFVQLRDASCFELISYHLQTEKGCHYSRSGLFNAVYLTFFAGSSFSTSYRYIYPRAKCRRFVLVPYMLRNKPGSIVRSSYSAAMNHFIKSGDCLFPRSPPRDLPRVNKY